MAQKVKRISACRHVSSVSCLRVRVCVRAPVSSQKLCSCYFFSPPLISSSRWRAMKRADGADGALAQGALAIVCACIICSMTCSMFVDIVMTCLQVQWRNGKMSRREAWRRIPRWVRLACLLVHAGMLAEMTCNIFVVSCQVVGPC